MWHRRHLLAALVVSTGAQDPVVLRLGGTLGLTGRFKEAALACEQGLKLVKEFLDGDLAPEPFRLPDGRKITIELDIRDDLSRADEAESAYQKMVNDGQHDAFIGPYSSELSLAAARVTDAAGQVLMLHAAATPSVYQEGFTSVFSTNILAYKYMEDGLDIVRAAWDDHSDTRGRTPTMVTLISCPEQPCMYNRAVCEGAAARGRELGFSVEAEILFTDVGLPEVLQSVTLMNPDIVVCCGYLGDVINVVVTSRAFSFHPLAMLSTQATGTDFINAVGISNANYLLAPVSWDKGSNLTCRIFGSAGAFADRYREKFGEDPLYHSAGAAAAALAVVAALESLNGSSWPPSAVEVRQGLKNLDLPTFYGRLTFGENGTLLDARASTQQVQPLGPTFSREERFERSHVRLVSTREAEMPLFPMPDWQGRELEIFPCEAGFVMDPTQANLTCIPCPVGTQRPSTELECRECGISFFNHRSGQATCELCPEGADCRFNRLVVPTSKAGYYLLPEKKNGEPLYEACRPGLCVGGNRCVGHNTGVLCQACERGHSNRGLSFTGKSSLCSTCPSVAVSGMLVMLFVGLYCVYIWGVGRLALAASMSVRDIHSVVLKIVVNYMQLCGNAFQAAQMEHLALPSLAIDFVDPFSAMTGVECILGRWTNIRHHEAATVVGLAAVPLALMVTRMIFWVVFMMDIRRLRQEALAMGGELAEMPAVQVPMTPFKQRWLASATNDEFDDDMSPMQLRRNELVMRMKSNQIRWAMVVVFFLYPVVVKMLLDSVTCVDHDVFRLRHEKDVVCLGGMQSMFMMLGFIGLGVYGLGIPLWMFLKLRRIKDKLMRDDKRRLLGFLYNGFQPDWYYFEVVYMVRKLLLLLCAAIPAADVRIVLMLSFSCLFLVIQIRCQPFDRRDYCALESLELSSILALIAILIYGLTTVTQDLVRESSDYIYSILTQPLLTWSLVVLVILCHTYFAGLAVWNLVRNIFVRNMHFKAECMPNSVSWTARLLLRFEANMNSARFSPDTHCLDLSTLKSREQFFLAEVLGDMMGVYIKGGTPFHPCYVATCLRIAVDLCVTERKLCARQLHKQVKKKQSEQQRNESSLLLMYLCLALRETVVRFFRASDPAPADEDDSPAGPRTNKAWRAELSEIIERIGEPSATMEELQNALMLCEPQILAGRGLGEFFERDQPTCGDSNRELDEEEGEGGDMVGETSSKRQNFQRISTLFGSEAVNLYSKDGAIGQEVGDADDALSRAATEARLDAKALERRGEDLEAEALHLRELVKTLQLELVALQEGAESAMPDLPVDLSNQGVAATELERSVPEELLDSSNKDKNEEGEEGTEDMEEFLNTLIHQRVGRFWCYKPNNGYAMGIRSQPELDSPKTDECLEPGTTFRVSEELSGEDGILFLKLADGRGWVFDRKPGLGIMCLRVDEADVET